MFTDKDFGEVFAEVLDAYTLLPLLSVDDVKNLTVGASEYRSQSEPLLEKIGSEDEISVGSWLVFYGLVEEISEFYTRMLQVGIYRARTELNGKREQRAATMFTEIGTGEKSTVKEEKAEVKQEDGKTEASAHENAEAIAICLPVNDIFLRTKDDVISAWIRNGGSTRVESARREYLRHWVTYKGNESVPAVTKDQIEHFIMTEMQNAAGAENSMSFGFVWSPQSVEDHDCLLLVDFSLDAENSSQQCTNREVGYTEEELKAVVSEYLLA